MSDFGGITMEEAAARAGSALGPCQHRRAEPVVLMTGEVVAAVCVVCLDRLPASWGCTDCEYVDVESLGQPWPMRVMSTPCGPHRR